MKGNTIVRKMKKLNDQQLLVEASLQAMVEGREKDVVRIHRQMHKMDKKFNNIWKHNVPHKPRKVLDVEFNERRIA